MKRNIVIFAVIFLGFSSWANEEFSAAQDLTERSVVTPQTDAASYRLTDPILRQELVGIIMNALYGGFGDVCIGYFQDVSATSPNTWACPVIEAAADKGVITRKNNHFRPEATLTAAEALAIMLGATCHNERLPQETWDTFQVFFGENDQNWQRKTMINAYEQGLIPQVDTYSPHDIITRGQTFLALSKSLNSSDCEKPPTQDDDKDTTGDSTDTPADPRESISVNAQLDTRSPDGTIYVAVLDKNDHVDPYFEGMVVAVVRQSFQPANDDSIQSETSEVVINFRQSDRGSVLFPLPNVFHNQGPGTITYRVTFHTVSTETVGSFNTTIEQGTASAPDEPEEPDTPDERTPSEIDISLASDPVVGVQNAFILRRISGDDLRNSFQGIITGGDGFTVSSGLNDGFLIESIMTFPVTFLEPGTFTLKLFESSVGGETHYTFTVADADSGDSDGGDDENNDNTTPDPNAQPEAFQTPSDVDPDISYHEVSCNNGIFVDRNCSYCFVSDVPAIIWKHTSNEAYSEIVYDDELVSFDPATKEGGTDINDWYYSFTINWHEFEGIFDTQLDANKEQVLAYYAGNTAFTSTDLIKYPLAFRNFDLVNFRESVRLSKNACVTFP